jgi:tetratricopeptide (TPR) repeat protein
MRISARVSIAATGSIFLVVGLASLPPSAWSEPREAIQRWSTTLGAIAKSERPRLYRGDLEGYVDAIRRGADAKDWASLFVAGNFLYEIAPDRALELHEAAAGLEPDAGEAPLELGYDYQRRDQCDRAAVAWSHADRLGTLKSPATGLAAYCSFKLGRLDEALAFWQRVEWRSHHTGLDVAIHAVFGGPSALRTHALLMARARAGDERALRELVWNALAWRIDWWNAESDPDALAAAASLLSDLKGKDNATTREFDCARRMLVAADAATARTTLEGCRLLVAPHPYPVSSEIAKSLVDRGVAVGVLDVSTLLTRFGAELATRAQSSNGDRSALEVLGYLQARTRDEAGLAQSNELGWRRYRIPEFATSRVAGLLLSDDTAAKAQGKTLLEQALRDFPDESRLLRYDFVLRQPQGADREAALVRLIVAEYHGLHIGDRTARALREFVAALAKARAPKP